MKALLLVSVLLSMGVGTYVGVHLIRLARRTHKAPEWAVGVGLLSYAAVSQLSILLLEAAGAEGDEMLRFGLATLRVLAYVVTLLGLAVFTWQAFGDTVWRRLLVTAIAAGSLAGAAFILHAVWWQIQEGRVVSGSQRLTLNLCFVTTFGWMGVESLRYHGRMRRRQALGLADAVVTNRFLLWGVGGVASALLVLGMLTLAWNGRGLAARDPLAELLATGIGLLNTVVWGLAFAPPESYLRWVRGRAGGETLGRV